MYVTTAEFNGLSPETYENGISELRISAKMQVSVICAHMVNFAGPVTIVLLLIY